MEDMQPGVNAPPMHPNCVLPDTKIIAPDIEAIMRSEYSGNVVELGLSNGTRLSVTPNHIVLTARGWVRAKNLIKGDKVVNYCGRVKSMVETNPTNNNGVPTIEKLFAALSKSSSVPTFSVPISAEDLKGDVIPDSKVDIVFINSELRNKFNSAINKLIGDILFIRTLEGSESVLNAKCMIAELLVGLGLVADGIMSSSRVSSVLFGRALTHHELVGFRRPSDYYARLAKTVPNNGSANSKLFGDCVLTNARFIKRNDESNINTILNRCGSISDRTSDFGYFAGTNSEEISNFLSGFTGFIHFDDIVSVDVRFYKGHVYDASSLSTLYIANGVITSNCRCSTSAYMERTDFGVSDEEVKLFDGWSETYDKHGLSWKDWKKLDEYDHNRLSKDHYIHPDKIKKYMLKEGAKHAKEFFDVGYSQENWRQLENDILEQVVKSSYDRKKTEYGKRFSVNMMLGVEKKKKFQVVWSQDVGEDKIRLITTHRIK